MPSFAFFAGKGGVGKTSCAVDAALGSGRSTRSAASTLIISTDPAHSLGDALGVRLGATPRRVRPHLSAVELDAPRAFRRWLTRNRRALSDVLERGTWLDRDDVDAVLGLTIPGVDELAGLIEIGALARGPFERIVVDTAPTGHTLRLLAAPAAVAVVAGVLDALEEEHRVIRAQLARGSRPDAADRFIEQLAAEAAEVAALLRNQRRVAFHWVTLPEPLAVAESEDGLAALERAGVRVAEVIVNRVWPKGPRCALCDSRRDAQRRVLQQIRHGIGRRYRLRIVHEHTRKQGTRSSKMANVTTDATAFPRVLDRRLIFVAGKGGVGKTTVAAAIALRLAHDRPSLPVLLLSTDPAHSLGDVFDAAAGDNASPITGGPRNLFVRELDAPRLLAARRDLLDTALDEVGGLAAAGAAQLKRLLDLAPPGIDELLGMVTIVDAFAAYSTIVVDTAPTGHTLRLLEMPGVAREWVQTLMRVVLKYKAIARPGRAGAELVEAAQSIRRLQALLHDRAETGFVVVTRAEATVGAESERLVRRLKAQKLSTPALIVNARLLEPRCRLCAAAAAAEQLEMRRLRRFVTRARMHTCAIIEAPLVAPPPRGAAALARWARQWQS